MHAQGERAGPPPGGHLVALSVAIVIGAQRERAATCLRALSGQTAADRIEVIVVDTRPHLGPVWRGNNGAVPPVVLPGAGLSYGEARALAVGAAHGELIAFLEDHCYPDPGWAEALLSADAGSAVAVGYSFGNANPDSRVSRVVYLATYAEWGAPEGGRVTSLPGGNVAYRRDALVDLGSQLADMLTADYNLHNHLRARQLDMIVVPAARVRHESEERYRDALRSSFIYSRALGAKRASIERWDVRTRVVVAAKDLLGAPLARLIRLLQAHPRTPASGLRLVAVLPAIMLIFIVSAVGEAAGYLLGAGATDEQLLYCEVDAPRVVRSPPPHTGKPEL